MREERKLMNDTAPFTNRQIDNIIKCYTDFAKKFYFGSFTKH